MMRVGRSVAVALMLGATACSSSPGATSAVVPAALRRPAVRQLGGSPLNWRTFPANVTYPLLDISRGPDGAMWGTSRTPPGLFRVGMNGATSFAPLPDTMPESLGVGPDRRLWIISFEPQFLLAYAPKTRELTAFYPYGQSGDYPTYSDMIAGADGNLWYTELSHLANITPRGKITEFAYPTLPGYGSSSLTSTPDGKIWFTEPDDTPPRIGWIDTRSHEIKDYPLPATVSYQSDLSLTVGTDGNIYLAASSHAYFYPTTFVRIDAGTLKMTTYPMYSFVVYDLAAGPNGLIYFAAGYPNTLGAFDPVSASVTFEYTPNGDGTGALAVGPDGNIWSAMGPTPAVGVFILNELSVVPASLQFSGAGQTGTITATYTGRSGLSAASSNPSVATVRPAGQPDAFVVTSHAAGSASVVVHDERHNSFAVKVTVQP